MRAIIGEWLEKHSAIQAVRICGREGVNVTTTAVVAVEGATAKPREGDGDIPVSWVTTRDELLDSIADELSNIQAEGDAFDGWRLYGTGADGKPVKSLARRFEEADEIKAPNGPASADPWAILGFLATVVAGLAKENVAMVRESRQTMGLLGGSMGGMATQLSASLEKVVQAEAGRMAAEAEAYEAAVSFRAAHSELEEDDEGKAGLYDMLAAAIEKILPGLVPTGALPGKVDISSVVRDVMKDPAMREEAMRAYAEEMAKEQAAGGGDGG